MALKNLFGDLSLDATSVDILRHLIDRQEILLKEILLQAKLTNYHLSLLTKSDATTEDVVDDN